MLSLAFEATSMALASLNWTILAHCAREKSRNFPMRAAGYTKGQLKEDIAFKEHKFNSTLENSTPNFESSDENFDILVFV